jgi:hypothetical protein
LFGHEENAIEGDPKCPDRGQIASEVTDQDVISQDASAWRVGNISAGGKRNFAKSV